MARYHARPVLPTLKSPVPELPEVETVRRGLEHAALGRRVLSATLHRTDVCRTQSGRPASAADLLAGDRIATLERRGKQLAIIGRSGRVIVVHLGMSGQLIALGRGEPPRRATHIHAEWSLGNGTRVIFRDPRRFGGIWTLTSREALAERWEDLGPDALTITGPALHDVAGRSSRAIKSVLLDQRALAGVGNIYADEALFRAGISPRRLARRLSPKDWSRLAAAIRETLRDAVKARGSTLRDYVGARGESGEAQLRHRVYGRGGQPCLTCDKPLRTLTLSQRTTVYCRTCQH